MSKGGFVAFRGSAAVATAYLAGAEPAHDAGAAATYLAGGSTTPFQHVAVTADGAEVGVLTRNEFRLWAEHVDPQTGEVRGTFRPRTRMVLNAETGEVETIVGGTPLYQETTISASKSLSLAAAANPEIGRALEAAMERATVRMAKALHEHTVTRVGPRGHQEQIHFDRIEMTSVQHHTSRTGDPHEHRHVQLLTHGLVTLPDGRQEWRSVDGAVLYRLSALANASADLSLSTDVELRQAIAAAGFTWQPGEGGGTVAEFEPLVSEFSARRDEVDGQIEVLAAQWRAEHPGQQPSGKRRQAWKNYAWSSTRPEKHELDAEARDDQAARLAAVMPMNAARAVASQGPTQIDINEIADDAVATLQQRQSAWSKAELKAAIDRRLAETYLLGEDHLDAVRADALEAAKAELVSFRDEGVDIEGARHYTSMAVLATDNAIERCLERLAAVEGRDGVIRADRGTFTLADDQAAAARSIAGTHGLVVVEGAAGTGKSALLDAANESLVAQGRRMVLVSPTKRGAIEMAKAVKGEGNSVHGMLVRAGASFDEHGVWTLPQTWKAQPEKFAMDADTVLVVDEAGMLDMGTAEALHTYVDAMGVGSVVIMGDRKQLSAVGRGGYLPKAVALSGVGYDLRDVQRFKTADKRLDDEYAAATLKLRDRQNPDEIYDLLTERGQVHTGHEPDEVIGRVAETVALEIEGGQTSIAVASTNATAQRVNAGVYERLVASHVIDDDATFTRLVAEGRAVNRTLFAKLDGLGAAGTGPEQRARLEELIASGEFGSASAAVVGRDGDRIAVGAKVATRQNDTKLRVANRQTWLVKHVNGDGRVTVADEDTGYHTTLGPEYVRDNLQLAYAVTAHGSQGMTVDHAHAIISDQMDAAGLYVGLTRGRYSNAVHAAAGDADDAREQFSNAVARGGSDQGLDEARVEALQEVDPAQQQVAGLAEFNSGWAGALPTTDGERRQFEAQAASLRLRRETLERSDVRASLDPAVHGRLMQRVDHRDSYDAAVQRWRDLDRRQKEFVEFRDAHDRAGIHGTADRIAAVREDKGFERGLIEQMDADRAAGVYTLREQEVQDHYAGRAQAQPTQTRERLDEALSRLTADRAQAADRDQAAFARRG